MWEHTWMQLPTEVRGEAGSSGARITGVLSLPMWCWEPNSGLEEEQHTTFLSTLSRPSLQTPAFFIGGQCMCRHTPPHNCGDPRVSSGVSSPLPSVRGLWGWNSGCETCVPGIFICSSIQPAPLLLFSSFFFQVHNLLYKLSITWWVDISFFRHGTNRWGQTFQNPFMLPSQLGFF